MKIWELSVRAPVTSTPFIRLKRTRKVPRISPEFVGETVTPLLALLEVLLKTAPHPKLTLKWPTSSCAAANDTHKRPTAAAESAFFSIHFLSRRVLTYSRRIALA